jgi:NADH:ubiquinone reductase (H+-translocating)
MESMLNIPDSGQERVVIVGCGFAGLEMAKQLKKSNFQVVLIDKNNYFQFQPLFYQVATAGLEPRDISFPIRKIFQKQKNIFIRITEVTKINPESNTVETLIGDIPYDHLVLAQGATTSYFGLSNVEKYSQPMKTVIESLEVLNSILHNLEDVLVNTNSERIEELANIVIVGGGPTGVELSGAFAEMKRYVLPKDYPELDCSKIRIILIEASSKLLGGLSEISSVKAEKFLMKLGVEIMKETQVIDYDGSIINLKDKEPIRSKTLIWAAGIKGSEISGFSQDANTKSMRLIVDDFHRVKGYGNIFALGDIACMISESWPKGHPQVAQVAIQSARNLSRNLISARKGRSPKPFKYFDWGTMATIGRNKAVVDLKYIKFQGVIAWFAWMFIHLRSIFGVKNKILILINWIWSYITYDQSLRITFLPRNFRFDKRINT